MTWAVLISCLLHARLGLGDAPPGAVQRHHHPLDQSAGFPQSDLGSQGQESHQRLQDYKKALGQPEGLAELTVFYCEEAFDFLAGCHIDAEGFYDALVRMFKQALEYVLALPAAQQTAFLVRLDRVRQLGQDLGWGVGGDFNRFWSTAGLTCDR